MNEQTVKGHWGKIIKASMDEQKISADTMSIDLKIPRRTIFNYLSGATEPTVSRFYLIADYLKINL